MVALAIESIVQHDVEAAGHGNDELGQRQMGMPAPFRAARHVVQVVHATDVERNLAAAFHEGQVARGSWTLGSCRVTQSTSMMSVS